MAARDELKSSGTGNGRRAALAAVAAVAVLGVLAACGGTGGGRPAATATPSAGVLGSAPPTSAAASPTAPPLAAPLACAQLREAAVTTAAVKLTDYPFDSINLTGGRWADESGAEIILQEPCGIGDFVGDAARDAVGVIALNTGGTGRFYSLVAWRNSGGSPVLVATLSLGDRNPVTAISIASKKITVVYLTRDGSASMAELNIKRTAVYKISGTTLAELSHTDEPYTP